MSGVPEKTITVELTEALAEQFVRTADEPRPIGSAGHKVERAIRAALATPSQEPRCGGTGEVPGDDERAPENCPGCIDCQHERSAAQCSRCSRDFEVLGHQTVPIDWGCEVVGNRVVLTCPDCQSSPEWCRHYSEATIEEAHEKGVRCFQVLTEQDTTAELAVMAAIDNAAAVLTAAIRQSEPEHPAVPEHERISVEVAALKQVAAALVHGVCNLRINRVDYVRSGLEELLAGPLLSRFPESKVPPPGAVPEHVEGDWPAEFFITATRTRGDGEITGYNAHEEAEAAEELRRNGHGPTRRYIPAKHPAILSDLLHQIYESLADGEIDPASNSELVNAWEALSGEKVPARRGAAAPDRDGERP